MKTIKEKIWYGGYEISVLRDEMGFLKIPFKHHLMNQEFFKFGLNDTIFPETSLKASFFF